MFVAWRDLRFARGRFALIAGVVALITVLVGFLSGLTGGLAGQNVSAVLALPGDRIVLAAPPSGSPSYTDSRISDTVLTAWQQADGVRSVLPVGITTTRATGAGAEPSAVTLIGLGESDHRTDLADLAPSAPSQIGLSAGAAAELGVQPGDSVQIGGATYVVGAVGADLWYSHTPVIVMTPSAWAQADRAVGGTGAPTALAVSGTPAWDAVAARTDTVASTPLRSLTALETFRSEVGSLGLMIALLFGISALVVGAFFAVWSLQRAGDVAVLKALGASTSSLVRDALGQALVVLVAGTGAGLLVVVTLGSLAEGALPFLLSPLTTLLPAAVMSVLGLGGAAVSLRTVVRADPLIALNSNR